MNRRIRHLLTFLISITILGAAGVAAARGPSDKPSKHHGGKHHMHAKDLTPEERLELTNKRIDRRVARMQDKLDLSDEQADQLRTIIEKRITESRDIRQRHRRAARKELRQLHTSSNSELDQVLTDEQKKKLEDLKQERRERRIERGTHRLADRLGLSDKQEASVKQTLTELIPEIRALRQNDQLEAADKRKKARALFEAAAADIEAGLDDAQTAEFQTIKAKLRHKVMHPGRGHHGKGRRGGHGRGR